MTDPTKKYRLYIDESGTPNYSKANSIKSRYLALVGVFISEKQNIEVLQPTLRDLKLMIAHDSDELPVLHREDIVAKNGAFAKLQDKEIEKRFNDTFLGLLKNLDYKICAVVLDKTSHLERYQKSAFHPYHYCLNVLLERYAFYLGELDARGDVLAEARGKNEDTALKEEYRSFYEKGTYYCKTPLIQQRLTSKEIKVKPKEKMFSGLEFVDLLSLAAKLDTLHSYHKIPELNDNFCKVIVEHIQDKYRKSSGGAVMGFGKKLIS
jgi:hypothetical protein